MLASLKPYIRWIKNASLSPSSIHEMVSLEPLRRVDLSTSLGYGLIVETITRFTWIFGKITGIGLKPAQSKSDRVCHSLSDSFTFHPRGPYRGDLLIPRQSDFVSLNFSRRPITL